MIRDRDRIYGTIVTRRLRAMGIRDNTLAGGISFEEVVRCGSKRPFHNRSLHDSGHDAHVPKMTIRHLQIS